MPKGYKHLTQLQRSQICALKSNWYDPEKKLPNTLTSTIQLFPEKSIGMQAKKAIDINKHRT